MALTMKSKLLLTVFSIALGSVNGLAEDWPQFRGSARDSKSTETGLWNALSDAAPRLAWMADGLGKGYASVSIVGNRVYTSGNTQDGQAILCLDALSGDVLWSRTITDGAPEHGYQGSRTTPTIAGDRLYAVTSDGRILCLNTADGSDVWQREFSDWDGKMMSGWGFSESPLVDGDVVVCTPGGKKGMVVALNKLTGDQVWSCVLPAYGKEQGVNGKPLKDGAGYASIMVSHGGGVKQYVQLVGRGVIGIRASDGELLWRYKYVANATANIPTVVIDGDHIFCSTAYETGSGLIKLSADGADQVKMEEVYSLKFNELQNKHGGMVLVDGHIYCGHGNGSGLPTCVRLSDGEVRWGPERGEGRGEASVLYADGHVLFRFQDGVVSIIKADPDSYQVVSSFKPEYQEGKSWAYPAIADGKLYLREQGKLMCYQLK